MSDQLPEFPDLATQVTRSVRPPAFEELARRASGRRRRRTTIALTTLALVVAAIAVGSTVLFGGHDRAVPPIDHPSPTPAKTDRAAEIVRTGTLAGYAAAGPHASFAVWSRCPRAMADGCQIAWRIDNRGRVSEGMVPTDTVPQLAPAPNGDVVLVWGIGEGLVVHPDGRTVPTPVDALRGDPGTDSVIVQETARHSTLLVDPTTAASRRLSMPSLGNADGWVQAVRTIDGDVFALAHGSGPSAVAVSMLRAGTTSRHPLRPGTLPGYLAASGHRVAAFSSFDGATILPVGDLAVTTDDGASWTDLQRNDLPFTDIAAMAATTAGTLFVSTNDGKLFRTTNSAWTRFTTVPASGKVVGLEPAGSSVVGRVDADSTPRLSRYDDAGHATPLPPLR